MILAGIAVEIGLILLIDYTPWGNAIFGDHCDSSGRLALMIPFAIAFLILEECRKWFMRLATLRGTDAGRIRTPRLAELRCRPFD
jgi:hypothetical protein